MKILNALKMFSYEYYTYPPCVYRLMYQMCHAILPFTGTYISCNMSLSALIYIQQLWLWIFNEIDIPDYNIQGYSCNISTTWLKHYKPMMTLTFELVKAIHRGFQSYFSMPYSVYFQKSKYILLCGMPNNIIM